MTDAAEEVSIAAIYDEDRGGDERPDPRPVSTLPLGQLDALDPRERRAFARRRGLDWPTTEEARDRPSPSTHRRILERGRHSAEATA